MEKFQKIDRNYFYHLVSFGVFYLFFTLINVTLLNRMFFSISYLWHTLLAHPNIQNRAQAKRYRYSFIKYVYLLDSYLQDRLAKNKHIYISKVLRAAQPFIFVTLVMIFSKMGNPLFSILGSIIYEGLIISFKKIPPHWPPDQLD